MFGINEKIVIGYDLSQEYVQISYCSVQDPVPETVALTPGTEQYNIPACLFKRSEVNQWFFGKEAIAYSAVEEGTMMQHLLEHALIGETMQIGEELIDPVALLALFVKRSFSLIATTIKLKQVVKIIFTVPELSPRAIQVLEKMCALLEFGDGICGFQGREESIYAYLIHQQKELWQYEVSVFDFSTDILNCYQFSVNRHTTPTVAFVNKMGSTQLNANDAEKDAALLQVILDVTKHRIVSCAYLIGDGFNGGWCRESLKELCRNRRAFKGNNLYSRGACYAAWEKIASTNKQNSIIFLGKDKLKANVGMDVLREGKESYIALLNGGENWYDSRKECDFLLADSNSFCIRITPLDGRNARMVEISLPGLLPRREKTTRLHLSIFMGSEQTVQIKVTDMGFGEIFPSSGQTFEQEISLYDDKEVDIKADTEI